MTHPTDAALEAMAQHFEMREGWLEVERDAKTAAMLRACKSPAPDARQEVWNAAIEAAATYVASMDSSIISRYMLYHTIRIASDQCASVPENREQALEILAEIAAAIRANAEKGPDHE